MSFFQLSSQHKEATNTPMKNNISWQFNSSHPLFSSIVTLYILFLLYFPHIFHKIIFSPLIISTLILLLCLLRLGASQQHTIHNELNQTETRSLSTKPNPKSETTPKPTTRDQENESHVSQLSIKASPRHEPENEPEGPEPELRPVATLTSIEFPGAEPKDEVDHNKKEDGHSQLSPEASSIVPEPTSKPKELDEDSEENDPGLHSYEASSRLELKFVAEPFEFQTLMLPKDDPKSEREPEPCVYIPTWPDLGSLFEPKPSFVEWDVGAPLEVIYETYEGEEAQEEDQQNTLHQQCMIDTLEKYPSLSRCYPESDSESSSSSSWDGELLSIERWDEEKEEEREGLIEIAIDYDYDHTSSCYNHYSTNNNMEMTKIKKKPIEVMHLDEEDNLIEIDISPTRASEFEFSW